MQRYPVSILLTFILAWSAIPSVGLDLYVAKNGSDVWSGTRSKPNWFKTDGPLATLEKARDVIRQKRAGGQLREGVTVWVRGGVYPLTNAFELLASDGGTKLAPVTYRAFPGEEVRFTGGKPLNDWRPVTDSAILKRMDSAAIGHVLQAEMNSNNINDWGRMTRRGFYINSAKGSLALYFNDQPMTLARWPNSGWARIAGVPAGPQGGEFNYVGERPRRWTTAEDAWLHGYWTFDWADSREKVRTIDPDKHVIQTEPPHGAFGYKAGQRYFAENLLEELDQPGEWFLDRKIGRMYFWPPAAIHTNNVWVSVLETPLIRLHQASFVTVQGFTFECSRGEGVEILGGDNSVVTNCVLRNLGGCAARIAGEAVRSGVASCQIYDVEETGVDLEGGDRRTLVPAGNFAVNNDIHDYARACFTYHPAVLVNGVGNYVAHNRLHAAPHNAILFGGNDHVFEYNEVYDVCRETGDAGAFYTGRNLTTRGTQIRYNYFHDIARSLNSSNSFVDVMSVYLDDCACGTTVEGNLFVRAGRAVMIGGGRDNVVENNVFIDCNPAVHVDARGEGWMKASFEDPKETIQTTLRAVPFDRPPYSTRYPHLADILQDRPGFPKYNRIEHNICVGPRWIEWQDGLSERDVAVRNNLTDGDPGFVDQKHGDYHLLPGSKAWDLGIKPLPLAKMGLLKP